MDNIKRLERRHHFLAPWVFLFTIFLLYSPALGNNAGGTCSADAPCTSGCCSSSGYCGYGPDFCGTTCISDCDAVADCGEYAAVNGTTCPLNVCCSQYSFCGTTTEFCDTNCQSNCDAPTKPTCSSSGGSATKKVIGYYESWSSVRLCDAWSPSDIDATKWTHLNYAFAYIDPSTYGLAQMNTFDVKQYTAFTNLKVDNPSLKVFISIGGWAEGGAIFSDMASTTANRAAFISSVITFIKTYAFDGVDIDWEYPVASDRGGTAADKANYVMLLSEMRDALGDDYGITATLPSSYWYMQNFDIANMEPYLDWFNIMTYDIHGTWDGNNPYTSAVVQAHTNLTEIDDAMDLLWRENIDSSKVVLGLGFYGRAFTLADPSCNTPGCAFSGGANPGNCTQTSGILSDAEISAIITQYNLTPTLDATAAVKYMSWDSDQWVSYDDTETFQMKIEYANSLCLGGVMAWALDLDTPGVDTAIDSLTSSTLSSDSTSIEIKKATVVSNSLTVGLFWTVCQPKDTSDACPTGYRALVQGHGKVFDADLSYNTGEGCHGGGVNGFQRTLCAASNVEYSSLQWGPGSASKACNSKCPSGWVTITKNSHITGQKSGCKSGKYAPLCAYEMTVVQNSQTCTSSSISQYLSGGLSNSNDPDGISDYTLESSTSEDATVEDTIFKRGGDYSQLEPSAGELTLTKPAPNVKSSKTKKKKNKKRTINGSITCGDTLPIGDIPIEIPATISVYYGTSETYYFFEPDLPKTTKTSSSKPTSVTHIKTTTTTYSTVARTCDGSAYPSPCAHYSSVIAGNAAYSLNTCSNVDKNKGSRPLPVMWKSGHTNSLWRSYIAQSYTNQAKNEVKETNCQLDEWPPALFQQGRRDGWIRYLPGDQNGGIPNDKTGGWKNICKFPPDKQVKTEGGPITDMGNYYLMTSYTSTIITLNVLSYTVQNVNAAANDPYELTSNVCRPSVLTTDVGFALMTQDPWYNGVVITDYNYSPGTKTINVQQPTFKRRFAYINGVIIVDEGNATRRATDQEMEDNLGYSRCTSFECREELDLLRQQLANAHAATDLGFAQSTVATELRSILPLQTTATETWATLVKPLESRPTASNGISYPTVSAGYR